MAEKGGYILDRSWEGEERRLDALQRFWDPVTTDHLARIGIAEGWRCLEVGAGSGSIARWMADKSGPSGHVVAVDLDTKLLERTPLTNVEIRQMDIMKEDLPTGFDLVHCRLILGHLPDPVEGLRRVYQAVRPGGWLLVEESDAIFVQLDDAPAFPPEMRQATRKSGQALLRHWHEIGFDPWWGRKLLHHVSELGLTMMEGEYRSRMSDHRDADLWRLSRQRFDAQLIEKGYLTAEEAAATDRWLGDPRRKGFGFFLCSIWGQKPEP